LLDRALANGRVRHISQQVTNVERNGKGWSVRTAVAETFVADFLVGADGVRSLVRRETLGPILRKHLALAVGYRVRGAPDALVFQTYADLEGYIWSFPRPTEANVGIVARLDAVPPRELWHRVDRFLAETCPRAKKVKRWAGLLPLAHDPSLWDTPCAGPGWALLGDAAGHVQPVTGEGIAYALWSAELLAEAFARGKPQAYESMWRDDYGAGLGAASTMSTGTGGGCYEVVFQLAMAMALANPGSLR